MAKPRVVLIGGAPGAGKTTLGRALATRLNGISLSADSLFTAAKAVTTPQSHPGLHVMNRPNFIEYFTSGPVDRLTSDADAQHEAIWPAIESVIRVRATLTRDPVAVIDGWYVRPNKIAELGMDNIASFWLVADSSVLEKRERSDEVFRSSSNPEQMLQNFLGRSYWFNDLIRLRARQLKLPILHQDGTVSVDSLCATIVKHIEDDG